MPQFPKTHLKLREAKFFLRHLEAEAKRAQSDDAVFRYYLSAFLSASRSITFFLQVEDKSLYDSSWEPWLRGLEQGEEKLVVNMNAQRVAEVHRGGVELESHVQPIPYYEVDTGSTRDPRYGVHMFGLMGMMGGRAWVHVVERTFDLGQGPQEVTATCRRYLSLLEDFVNEVEQR